MKKMLWREFFDGFFEIFFNEVARSFPRKADLIKEVGHWISSFFSSEKRTIRRCRKKYRGVFPDEVMCFRRFIGNGSKAKFGKELIGKLTEEQRFLYTVWRISTEEYARAKFHIAPGIVQTTERLIRFAYLADISNSLMRKNIDETYMTWGQNDILIKDDSVIVRHKPPVRQGISISYLMLDPAFRQMLDSGLARFVRF